MSSNFIHRLEDKLDDVREKSRKSLLLIDLIEQSEYDIDEGNILKTLTRIVNIEVENEVKTMKLDYGKK